VQFGTIHGLSKPVSRIIQGGNHLAAMDKRDAFAVLDGALATGVNAFDNAKAYDGGRCEEVFGHWLQHSGRRDDVVIITKGAHPARGWEPRVTPKAIRKDLRQSLERLQTDFIDIYLLHRDNLEVPFEPLIDTLNDLREKGKIGAFGVSNWTAERIHDANWYAEDNGLMPFAVSSPHFSLAELLDPPWPGCISITGDRRKQERQFYIDTALPVFAWSSLAQGLLSGHINRLNIYRRRHGSTRAAYASRANWQRLARARKLAKRKSVSVAQIALAYVLHQPFFAFPIAAAATPEEARANAAAVDVVLSADELDWLESG